MVRQSLPARMQILGCLAGELPREEGLSGGRPGAIGEWVALALQARMQILPCLAGELPHEVVGRSCVLVPSAMA